MIAAGAGDPFRTPGSAPAAAERITDYAGYDFRRLWADRSKVTDVERRLLARILRYVDATRVLETGSGFGRLTPVLLRGATELVASDFDRSSLESMRPTDAGAAPALRVAANLYHLPFVNEAFSFATLIRVHHHLERPEAALAELHRVVRPGGTLLVSYNPRPSLGTLAVDLERSLGDRRALGERTVTFARSEFVAVPADPFPVFVGTRRRFREDARNAGWRPVREWGTGVEELPGVRRLPASLFVAAAERYDRIPGFPMRWALLQKAGAARGALPPLTSLLACPVCGRPWPRGEGPTCCDGCGFESGPAGSAIDLRYTPPGAVRHTAPASPP